MKVDADSVFMRPAPKVPEDVANAKLFSGDIGAGTILCLSSMYRKIISLEPMVAPMTKKRNLEFDDEDKKPRFTLVDPDGQVLVFGVQDVFNHGQTRHRRRLSSLDRFLTPDYHRFFDLILFHSFKQFAGNNDPIQPTGIISVPVTTYDDKGIVNDLKDSIVGLHAITDMDGATLLVDILPERFTIVTEGYGAKRHRDYDPVTLQRREDVDTAGSTIVVDIGYETVNTALFVGSKYIPDSGDTLVRGGFGVVVRAVHNWISTQLKGVDVSRVDVALRAIAGVPLGQPKFITIADGVRVDVQPIYDLEILSFSDRIVQWVATGFADTAASRVLISGGTVYHVSPYITEDNIGWSVELAPNPEVANPLGVMTRLYQEALKRQK